MIYTLARFSIVIVLDEFNGFVLFNVIDFGFSSVLNNPVLQLIRSLVKYGPVVMEVQRRRWRIGCLVRLPAGIQESFVYTYSDNLSEGLKELIRLADEENKRLWKIQRSPKQGNFFYGSENKNWKEIV